MYVYAHFKSKIEEVAGPLRCLGQRYDLIFCLILIHAQGIDQETLIKELRCSDKVVRLDEEHFAVIFLTNKEDGYLAVSNKLFYALERLLGYEKFSMGVACSCNDGCSDVIATAIRNLFEAKEMAHSAIVDQF